MSYTTKLPVTGTDGDMIISTTGALTAGFRTDKPEIYTLSGEGYTTLHQQYAKALRILPPGTIVHCQDYFWADRHSPEPHNSLSWLNQASDRFFYERPWMRHEAYIFLTRPPEYNPGIAQWLSRILRGQLVPSSILEPNTFTEFLATAGQFAQVLRENGQLGVTPLTKQAVWSTDKKAGIVERYCSLDDNRVMRDIQYKPFLQVGDKMIQVFSFGDAADQPDSCAEYRSFEPYRTPSSGINLGYAHALGLFLPFDHIYNQYIIIPDQAATQRQLQARQLRMQALSGLSPGNAVGAAQIAQFNADAAGGQDPIIRKHFNVMIWNGDRSALDRHAKRLMAALAQMDIRPKLETLSASVLWWAGIPGNAAALPQHETQISFASRAICYLQHETQYQDSISATGLRLNDRLTGRPLNVDLFHEPRKRGITGNSNMIVIAGSGGGKSFYTNHLVRALYEAGAHVLIVDMGRSYEIQCLIQGGRYFACDEDHPLSVNPFLLAPGEEMNGDKKEHIQALLVALWKKAEEPPSRSEYAALNHALSLYGEKLQQTPTIIPGFNSFYEFMNDDFRSVLEKEKVRDKDFDCSNFCYVMKMFYKGGQFDYLLNADTNIDLTNERFLVFELDQIRDHPILLVVTTLLIMSLYDAKIRRLPGVDKLIVIEEAWKSIASQGMATYVQYLYKTMRKHRGIPVFVSQEAEDLVSSAIIRQAVIANSDIRVLLDQSKYQQKFTVIQELLGLSEQQKAEILSINRGKEPGRHYKDIWIGLGATDSRVYRLEVSPEEYYVYTSDQTDKIKVWEYIRRHGDPKKAIQALVADEKNS